ncbi:morn repeat protein [Stylonychia lemnae]|uniref:Morn repeat protein n=1 Tax=Stylonychia lemnae TaxID=5949 RepID=A0A077ZWD1_STYLE|nr:morn repeat protein [Stylonychia lemnae]|eukprot:CDW74250.1 morn repeat protein [Stylonychia lemnae]
MYCCSNCQDENSSRRQIDQHQYNSEFKKPIIKQQFSLKSSGQNEKAEISISELRAQAAIKIQAFIKRFKTQRQFQVFKMIKDNGTSNIQFTDMNLFPQTKNKKVRNVEKKIGPIQLFRIKSKQETNIHNTRTSTPLSIINDTSIDSIKKISISGNRQEKQSNSQLEIVFNYRQSNGMLYGGQFNNKAQQKDGYGIQIWPDGSKYEGFWKKGLANGYGRFILAEGDTYEGDWLNDKAHGHGRFWYSDGSTYEGSWINDKQEGYGIEKWKDGSYFMGMYQQGKKSGKGKFIWGDGAEYSGDWQNNKMHGKGTFSWPDGRVFEGEYYNDKKHGNGIYIWPSGKRVEGKWENGKFIREKNNQILQSITDANDSNRHICS